MTNIFGNNSPLVRGVKKVLNLFLLNFMWLLTSLPLVTLGVTAAAFYDTAYKDLLHDRGQVILDYVQSLRRNIKQGMAAGCICVLFAILLLIDIHFLQSVGEAGYIWGEAWILLALFGALFGVWFLWLAALIARFSAPLKDKMQNALVLMFKHLPVSLLMLFLLAGTVLLIWLLPGGLFVLPALAMLAVAGSLQKIFWQYMMPEERILENERNGKTTGEFTDDLTDRKMR